MDGQIVIVCAKDGVATAAAFEATSATWRKKSLIQRVPQRVDNWYFSARETFRSHEKYVMLQKSVFERASREEQREERGHTSSARQLSIVRGRVLSCYEGSSAATRGQMRAFVCKHERRRAVN